MVSKVCKKNLGDRTGVDILETDVVDLSGFHHETVHCGGKNTMSQEIAFITVTNSSGKKIEPWLTPTLIGN